MAVTKYLWDEGSYLEEYDEVGTTTAAYTIEPTEFGSIVSQRRNIETNFYHYDAQGSTHQLTDQSENVTDTFLYDAWGNVVTRTGTTTTPFRYIGEFGYYFDEETDSYYVRARVYQPTIGRWLSVDPSGYSDGMNLYLYVMNSPIDFLDPSGLRCKQVCDVKYYTSDSHLINNLDAPHYGNPFRSLADLFSSKLNMDEGPYKIVWPKIVKTGLYANVNIQTKTASIHKLFFVEFIVCEDAHGDCRFFLDETGSQLTSSAPGYKPSTIEYGNAGDITDQGDVRLSLRRKKEDGCDHSIIYMDGPGGAGIKPNWTFRFRLLQKYDIRDRSSNALIWTGGYQTHFGMVNGDVFPKPVDEIFSGTN